MPKKVREIIINPKLCKGCQICISVCPQRVLDKSKGVDNRGYVLPTVVNLSECKLCRLCEMECPDFAISVIAE